MSLIIIIKHYIDAIYDDLYTVAHAASAAGLGTRINTQSMDGNSSRKSAEQVNGVLLASRCPSRFNVQPTRRLCSCRFSVAWLWRVSAPSVSVWSY